MNYVHTFDTKAEQIAYYKSSEYREPCLSYEKETNEVKFNKHDYSKDYLTFEALENGTFQFTNACSYSVDGGETWISLAASTSTPVVNAGEKIMFKAENTPAMGQGCGVFSSTGAFDAIGNPYSMFSGDNFVGANLPDFACMSMFSGCTGLTSADKLSLPASTLSARCYLAMFSGCTSLNAAPTLPIATLAGNCYQAMFAHCTSLVTPPELPQTTMAASCYYHMFEGCTSLEVAPKLPAETLASYCYADMFNGCLSLATAPELPAETLVTSCYQNMFFGCSSLNYIKMLATNISATECLSNWTNLVSASGTFVKAASMTTLPEGTSGIPTGWTIQDA